MDPFHVVALAGKAMGQCRQRIQQATLARRGRSGDPLYGARNTLLTGHDYLTDKQQTRLENVFADQDHKPVHAPGRSINRSSQRSGILISKPPKLT